jgi:hypothetical protein
MLPLWPTRPCADIRRSWASLKIHPVVRSLHEETIEQARELVRTLFLGLCDHIAGYAAVELVARKTIQLGKYGLTAHPSGRSNVCDVLLGPVRPRPHLHSCRLPVCPGVVGDQRKPRRVSLVRY